MGLFLSSSCFRLLSVLCSEREGRSSSAAEAEHRAHLRRAVVASTVGTTIEWYDFLIYSTMTGLVFGKVFFSGSDPLIDTLKAVGVFFIGLRPHFLVSVLGAILADELSCCSPRIATAGRGSS
jgi:hypothetical protein